MKFDPQCDNIAIVLSALKLRQSADFMDSYSEPYVMVVGMDETSADGARFHSQLNAFSNVRAYQPLVAAGEGLLLYGPANPGAFVTLSVAIMESDAEIRQAGQDLQAWVSQAAQHIGVASLLATNPGATTARSLVEQLLGRIASRMRDNQDDNLLTVSGCWFRDRPVPYNINSFSVHHNDFAEATLKVIPLPPG